MFVRLLILLTIFSGVALAQPLAREPMTPKQLRALRVIRDRHEGKRQDLQIRLQGKRLELAKLIRDDDVEKSQVQAKLDEILSLERQRQQVFLDEIFEAKGQLSRAQWGPFRQRVLRNLLQERRRGGQLPRRESDQSSL